MDGKYLNPHKITKEYDYGKATLERKDDCSHEKDKTMSELKTSEKVKIAGLKNLTWVAGKYGKTPELFAAVVWYAVEQKKKGEW